MNERIKQLRKHLGLNQSDFASRLGVSQSAVAGWELGTRNPMDTVIRSICREFNVSELWLREGQGEMFVPRTLRQEVLELGRELLEAPPGDFRRDFLLSLADLPPEFWPALRDFMERLLHGS